MCRIRMATIVSVLALGCLVMTRALGEESKEKHVRRTIAMPAPSIDSGNPYARGMSAILSCLGTNISYDRVMGLTGVAFILQVDTSGPYLPGNELDCAWWPNDDWGFELGLPVLAKAVGWDLRKLSADMKAYEVNPAAEYRRVFAAAIHLRYDRKSAVSYLRDMAGRHTGNAAKHLGAAADLYQRTVDELMKGELPHPGPAKGGLAAYTAMVERVASLEAAAIAELTAAASDTDRE